MTERRVALAQLRDDRGMTQKEFGDAIGVTGNTVSLWELGKTDISRENRRAIAGFYGLPKDVIDKMIDGDLPAALPICLGGPRAGQWKIDVDALPCRPFTGLRGLSAVYARP